MNWILLAVAGGALLCPITMFGPMLLERLGLRKSRGCGGMSCMGMGMNGGAHTAETDVDGLRAQRDAIDREIVRAQASLNESDASQDQQARSVNAAPR